MLGKRKYFGWVIKRFSFFFNYYLFNIFVVLDVEDIVLKVVLVLIFGFDFVS